MSSIRFLCILIFVCRCSFVTGQTIKGEVRDMDDKNIVTGVSVENIYTSERITTDEKGAFSIAATSGQLLEFRKAGFKLVRVRIPNGFIPSYFMILISKGLQEIKDMDVARSTRYDFKSDSIRYHDIYAHELDFPKLSGIDMIASPFSALSSKNREIWRFQDEYDAYEKEKYVDRTFTESLVTKFTGLKGDSLHYYMRRYRPTYDQIRNMNDYTFYNFIKTTVHQYRNVNTPRGAQ